MAWLHSIVGKDGISRRHLIKLGILAALKSIPTTRPAFAATAKRTSPERSLAFYNTHTGESLRMVYWANGGYLAEALTSVNRIMRDHRSGEIKAIDPRLLDLVHAIGVELDSQQPFHIISGYRSPQTNSFLCEHSEGVAKNSLHIYGKAVDVRHPKFPLEVVRQAAIDLRGGGVGYYPRPDFVHVDLGRIRYW